MTQFPDESRYEPSQDGTDVIRPNCSVAINRVLGMFRVIAEQDKAPRWNIFLINGATLLKNVYNDTMTPQQARDAFVKEADAFLVYVEAYLSRFLDPDSPNRVPFIIYLPDYEHIPTNIRRPLSTTEAHFLNLYNRFKKEFPRRGGLVSVGTMTLRYIVPVGGPAHFPHTDLAVWAQQEALSNGGDWYKWGSPAFIMTNYVTDLYIMRRFPQLQLVERYTAQIKPISAFGTKILKSTERKKYPNLMVPFNIVTHRAFGDDLQIQPIAQRNVRKALIEAAINKKWMTQSPTEIAKQISTITDTPLSELYRVRL